MKKEDKKDNSFEEYFDNIHDEVINNMDNHLFEAPDLNHQVSSDDPILQKALYDSLNNK